MSGPHRTQFVVLAPGRGQPPSTEPPRDGQRPTTDGGTPERIFWPDTVISRPGIEPVPPALEPRSLNHWTTREVPASSLLVHFLLLVVEHILWQFPGRGTRKPLPRGAVPGVLHFLVFPNLITIRDEPPSFLDIGAGGA
ncbi:zinc finger HIT domain-containing protein 3 isoform X2 [Neophocaena asiaeorientalis asiaeorientalis]|uniref:Zinc finger HIT domain-containing protein 3 isoform X2 n=1 Tax=Neophocaena asiaeorientalis asiaeorientalis TaxID=1706337 RepID=A0A341CFU0_NEOAA|nr:zinc finger HIT domain-containing protein 3 isoform X2 [Neophocaena asiaeorientalis asiaeorientalis]